MTLREAAALENIYISLKTSSHMSHQPQCAQTAAMTARRTNSDEGNFNHGITQRLLSDTAYHHQTRHSAPSGCIVYSKCPSASCCRHVRTVVEAPMPVNLPHSRESPLRNHPTSGAREAVALLVAMSSHGVARNCHAV